MFKKVLVITLLSMSCINASEYTCCTKNIIEHPINYSIVPNKQLQNLVYESQKQYDKKAQNNSWGNYTWNCASWFVKGTAGAMFTAYVVVPKLTGLMVDIALSEGKPGKIARQVLGFFRDSIKYAVSSGINNFFRFI